MDLREIVRYKNFVVVGNTMDASKYAFIIKRRLQKSGYNVECVDKELQSINDTENEIDILILCVHRAKGIKYLKENTKKIKCVLIQPGAESPEIIDYLNQHNQTYLEGCILVGLNLYK